MTKQHGPVMLVIMDGWGNGKPDDPYNAVATAGAVNVPKWLETYPSARLITSGEQVGLPDGQMGNSEVGHLNIGAGRIIYQELTRIRKDIASGEFYRKPALQQLLRTTRERGRALHVMGLVSPGGVHSHQDHLLAVVRAAQEAGIAEVYVHAFLDGRDVPPQGAGEYLDYVEAELEKIGVGRIASIVGRYYAMDRDKRWQRTRLAYDLVTRGCGIAAASAAEGLENAYARGETDEFVLPTRIGEPVSMQDGDGVVFFNFRPDRARQLTAALILPDFAGFARTVSPVVHYLSMTRYEDDFPTPVIYEKEQPEDVFGEVVSRAGYRQLRIAETEKYAHVTYFFNGGREEPYPGEDRILVPSPKVATYDLQPEMSAYEVTEQLLAAIAEDTYDFIILNFANADMVGHTGVLSAAQAAVRTVDTCLGKLWEAVRAKNGYMLVTADHGNAEIMRDPVTGEPATSHTTNPVPVFLLGNDVARWHLHDGILADLAPTLLALGGVAQPAAMTGKSLLDTQEV
ncbi:MAG: 2,3-bisphosphoglycerate-independent phosphoglycerate mutase [Veillonellaceae bacterium]|nr:2,3-bisphosphoglycerate-independent phosphoglycerate mutase [Veillonellaceae bacterium]